MTADAPAGDITLNTTGNLNINQSQVANVANTGTTGNAGNINVSSNVVELTGGGQLRTRTLGKGDAGNIKIQAGVIYADNPAYTSPSGNASLDDKPIFDASNYSNDSVNGYGTGRSGNVSLFAKNSITLIGEGEDPENKVISTYNRLGGKGGGDISIFANDSIFLKNAYIVSSTFSQDRGGGNISLQGNQSISITDNSRIKTASFSRGDAGNIILKSDGPISVKNSLLSAEVGGFGSNPKLGNGGDITILGRSVSITDGSEVTSSSISGGKSGNIQVNATDLVEISGKNPFANSLNRPAETTLQTTSEANARGPSGDISINVPNGTLLVYGGKIRSRTLGRGDAGNININAGDIFVFNQLILLLVMP